ncbi:conserved hypothetical protein [Cupriavidus taiwanensis]|jgi:hypothetical protein|uniref:Uncharacterized protein n=1 Tax=Cupriavidus taiwanensis TaxID=164546 RepID=A0A7Z7NRT2_9BURK|nr:conserved hypothetical protein [Cupriavidus taiwanensis]SPC26075.1 conserved hypothetical protein [Cupriavidus taiwanensis]
MRSLEPAPCPLCAALAERGELPSGNGFSYRCATCGNGVFEVGTGALARIQRDGVHPDLPPTIRRWLQEGRRPRIELNGGKLSSYCLPVAGG